MILSDIQNYIESRLQTIIPENASSDQIITIFIEYEQVDQVLAKIFPEVSYLRQALVNLVTNFTTQHHSLIKDYFDGEATIHDVGPALILFLVSSQVAYDQTQTLESLAMINEKLDQVVKSILVQGGEHLSLCGYGIGNGKYELQLAEYLTSQGKAITLFGYDPNAGFDEKKIQACSTEALKGNALPRFDIVLTRWVLHHVEPAQRWQLLVACINRARPGARIIIIEEGAFAANKSKRILLYEYLQGCADILVNSILYPAWLDVGGKHLGQHFYLNYLTEEDILNLESNFRIPAKRHVEWIQNGYFPQTVITYSVR